MRLKKKKKSPAWWYFQLCWREGEPARNVELADCRETLRKKTKKKWGFFVSCKTTSEMLTWTDFFSFTLCASSHGTCEHELSVQITLTDPACCYFLVAGDSHFSRVKHGASGNSSSDVTACNGEFPQPSSRNVCILWYTWVRIFQMLLLAWESFSSLYCNPFFFWKYKAKKVSTEWKPAHIIDHLLFICPKNRYQWTGLGFF